MQPKIAKGRRGGLRGLKLEVRAESATAMSFGDSQQVVVLGGCAGPGLTLLDLTRLVVPSAATGGEEA